MSKDLSIRDMRSMTSKATLKVLEGISSYSKIVNRIEDMAENSKIDMVKLTANKMLLDQHEKLTNMELKNPTSGNTKLSDLTSQELKELLNEAEKDQPIDVEVEDI